MRLTNKQILCLRYCGGVFPYQPCSLSVFQALQSKGLITWEGWIPRIGANAKFSFTGKGWTLTDEGKSILTQHNQHV